MTIEQVDVSKLSDQELADAIADGGAKTFELIRALSKVLSIHAKMMDAALRRGLHMRKLCADAIKTRHPNNRISDGLEGNEINIGAALTRFTSYELWEIVT